jgi:hypothetical protein
VSRIVIAPIVEGHGEDHAVRTLLQRIWTELLGGEHAEIVKPIRSKRYAVVREKEFERAVSLACLKLSEMSEEPKRLVLVLLDADADPPCILGPNLLAMAQKCRADVDAACVLANVEYETWFVAAAESLGEYLQLEGAAIPSDPEAARAGKGWIGRHFLGPSYSESVDQPRMTARMDLRLCRRRSKSFDKLCRELEKRI